jgi:UDP-N-acetylglucosamine 2-epimerase
MKIAIIMGTRPEALKNYSIIKALKQSGIDHLVVHTNQHHDASLNSDIFSELRYGPDLVFERPYKIGTAIDWVCDIINENGVDTILVNGDTAAAFVGATAALYSDVQLVHVEAGLRSHDFLMVEERNRIMVDAIAHILITYTKKHAESLATDKNIRGRIYNLGNTSVDLINDFERVMIRPSTGKYAYITMHRKEFTDSKSKMKTVFDVLNNAAKNFDNAIFPMHPRTKNAMRQFGMHDDDYPWLRIIPPVLAMESLGFIKHATVVITDSGCIQEEAAIFGVPCVTIRDNTERPETVEAGANIVTGFERESIRDAIRIQTGKVGQVKFPPVYGAPGVGQRIVEILLANARGYKKPLATQLFDLV